MKTKISYSIALCRHNPEKNNNVEILLIKKRYSYHYFSFVMGHYKKTDVEYILYLFDNMSYSEKIDILSMQFSQMWYRIWLNNPEKSYNITEIYTNTNFSYTPLANRYSPSEINKIYRERKSRFEKNFLVDNGEKLRSIITHSADSEILWEMPKGGKNDPVNNVYETNIDCAIREFYEETSINSSKFRILYNVKPLVDSYIDEDTIYKTVFYIAALTPGNENLVPKIDFRHFEQITEVEQIRWVTLAEIKFFNLQKPAFERLNRLYKVIITLYKKNNKMTATSGFLVKNKYNTEQTPMLTAIEC